MYHTHEPNLQPSSGVSRLESGFSESQEGSAHSWGQVLTIEGYHGPHLGSGTTLVNDELIEVKTIFT